MSLDNVYHMGRPKKKLPKDQFQNLKGWLDFYQENKKLPYNEIICCKCKAYPAKLKGVGMSIALKAAGGDISIMLKSTMCKDCKLHYSPPKEKKPVVKKIKTQLEIDEEIERIRRDIPKIDLNKPRITIDLNKDKKACAEFTKNMCIRPDIYLDNDRTCDYCSINDCCSCDLKRFMVKKKSK
jgi:hypothetical protein